MTIPDELKKISEAMKNGSELIKFVYQDTAQPGLKKVGMALETVFDLSNTILLPIKLVNEKSKIIFVNNMERYKRKIEHIEEDDIVDVPPEIGIPLLDKLTYTQDYYVSEMYLNLLASASSKSNSMTTHPSFIRLVECLSPDEAKIILFLTDKYFEKKEIKIKYIYYRATFKAQQGGRNLTRKMTGIEHAVSIQFKNNIPIYLENFIGLGLIVDKEPWVLIDPYDELTELYKEIQAEIDKIENKDQFSSIDINKSYYEVTDFGKLFIYSCSFNLRHLLTKGVECIQSAKYNEAIQHHEELIGHGFPYSSALLNLLELYLITDNIQKYEELYQEYEASINNKASALTQKYFSILHAYFTKNYTKMKNEIILCLEIECTEKIKMGSWSFSEILSTLKTKPDDKNKIMIYSFIKYLNSEIENSELIKLIDPN